MPSRAYALRRKMDRKVSHARAMIVRPGKSSCYWRSPGLEADVPTPAKTRCPTSRRPPLAALPNRPANSRSLAEGLIFRSCCSALSEWSASYPRGQTVVSRAHAPARLVRCPGQYTTVASARIGRATREALKHSNHILPKRLISRGFHVKKPPG